MGKGNYKGCYVLKSEIYNLYIQTLENKIPIHQT